MTRHIDDVKTPWTSLIREDANYLVYSDGFAVTPGHCLFVPKYENDASIECCLIAAHRRGVIMVEEGECDGFNVGLNHGTTSGQTVMWPHVHLIPRRLGDMEDPRGGVRNVIPAKGNYLSDQ